MTRRNFTKAVKVEIMSRCKVETGWTCENCGVIVASGEIDHIIADALCVDKTSKLSAKDGAFLCWPCHQGPDGKTPKDKAAIAKAKRVEAKYVGADRPAGNIKSAPFPQSGKPVRTPKKTLPQRPFYR